MSSNQKYWTIFGCFLAAIAGFLAAGEFKSVEEAVEIIK